MSPYAYPRSAGKPGAAQRPRPAGKAYGSPLPVSDNPTAAPYNPDAHSSR